ncbi:MAG TPA: cell division protein FtsZ [Candidatus Limnocylindrales bacterium]
MDAFAQTLLQVAVGILVVLLLVRLLVALPPFARRVRRPEGRTIRVVGVGGGGSNAVDHMIRSGTKGVEFIACNTDAQALRESAAPRRIRIGGDLTRGLGAGGDPAIGRRAAEEDVERIRDALAGSDLVFITAGLGGGTGSGAGPIVAKAAKDQGALTVGVVTKPFAFEGTKRRTVAAEAASELLGSVDALITIPNDRVAEVVQGDASLLDAFGIVDDVLRQDVQGLIDVVSVPGLINLDFADVRAIMADAGPTLMGLGRAAGEDRAVEAAREAMSSPLLEARIDGAKGILFDIAGSSSLRLAEVTRAADAIREVADPDANVIFGASFDDTLGDEVRLTLIGTGLPVSTVTSEPTTEPGKRSTEPGERSNERRDLRLRPLRAAPVDRSADAPVVLEPVAESAPATKRVESGTSASEPNGSGPVDEAVAGVPPAPDHTEEAEAVEREPAVAAQAEEPEDLEVPSFIRRRRASGSGSERR